MKPSFVPSLERIEEDEEETSETDEETIVTFEGKSSESLEPDLSDNSLEYGDTTCYNNFGTESVQGLSNVEIYDSAKLLHIPGKNIYVVSPNVQQLRVNVLINNVLVEAVVDTGAARTLLSLKVAKLLELEIVQTGDKLCGIGGDSVNIIGTCTAEIELQGLSMGITEFTVVSELDVMFVPLLLGIDVLRNNHMEICIKQRKLIKHFEQGGFVEIYLDSVGKVKSKMIHNVHCYASEAVHIQQGTIKAVTVNWSSIQSDDSEMILYCDDEKDRKLESKVYGLPGVFSIQDKKILLMATDDNITIKKGQSVGSLSTILQLHDSDELGVELDPWTDEKIQNEISLTELTQEQREQVYSVLKETKTVLSLGDHDIGNANVTEHHIELYSNTPIYQRPRRFPGPVADEVERQCLELNSLDIIEPSISPWSSPVVPVRKKDGSIRLCIDYRQLNKITIPDKFPMPNLNDSIFGLKGTQFFTKLDLVRGYYQIPIEKGSREYTAFSTSRNHWQFKRLSFGLRNAPSAFQREIQAVLSAFPSNKVIAYIDDILIMGSSFEEHLSLVSKVLKTLQRYDIKIKPCKCEWFLTQVEYLGHMVGRSGIRKTPDYVNKIEEFPQPTNVGELREFLGLVNFQRKFVRDCSEIQKPLSELTGGRRKKSINWTTEMLNSFNRLKEDMKSELELAYPDYDSDSKKLELWVDASAKGAGACLAQEQEGGHRIIGYASMTFTPTQMNYSTLERELAALRWGIKTFRHFLYGIEFILYTDHQPLIYLHNMRLVCSRLARTMEELSDFAFEIRYTPGHLNYAADALSRSTRDLPCTSSNQSSQQTLPEGLGVDGQLVPGGGDSLFVSLCRLLSRITETGTFVKTDLELREQLIDELLAYPERYKLDLDKLTRKQLKLMRHRGQLPLLDVLLAVSRLYSVNVYVYFWPCEPVMYQFKDSYTRTIHLQCLGGVHFNPLLELRNYSTPEVKFSNIVNVGLSISVAETDSVEEPYSTDEDSEDETDGALAALLVVDNFECCAHEVGLQPQVLISIGNSRLCAVLDTGAEISMISECALDALTHGMDYEISMERYCDVVGVTGVKIPITSVVVFSFSIGSYTMNKPHKFAIVPEHVMPHCLILGIDFQTEYDLSIDLHENICKHSQSRIAALRSEYNIPKLTESVLFVEAEQMRSNIPEIKVIAEGSDVRFEIRGNTDNTVTGLTMLLEDDTIVHIQSRNCNLRLVKRHVMDNVPVKDWPGKIKRFSRYVSKLCVLNGVLVYLNPEPVIVVTFEILLELALVLHYNFAHVGRDKLLDLLSKLLWHPSKYKVVNDVCTTCPQCQILKVSSTPIIPPTLKISTSYPFELMAADLIALPRTNQGHIGCLVVVDHHSKWVAAVPIKNKKTSSIVDAFSNKIFPFLPRIPTKLLTDNGQEFASAEFAMFLEHSGVAHQFTTPYRPSSNGAVERVNRTIQCFLRSLVHEDDWDIHLSHAVIVYNNTYHSELGVTPSVFLLSKSHKLGDLLLSGDQVLRQKWRLGHPKFLPFKVGQFVLMKAQHKGFLTTNKLIANYRGPFMVSKVNDNGITYQLTNWDDRSQVVRAHHLDLRFYKNPPDYIVRHPYFQDMNRIDCFPADVDVQPEYPVVLSDVSSADIDLLTLDVSDVCCSVLSDSEDSDSDGSFSGFTASSSDSKSSFSGFATSSLNSKSSFSGFVKSDIDHVVDDPRKVQLEESDICLGCIYETQSANIPGVICCGDDTPLMAYFDLNPSAIKVVMNDSLISTQFTKASDAMDALLDWRADSWELSAIEEDDSKICEAESHVSGIVDVLNCEEPSYDEGNDDSLHSISDLEDFIDSCLLQSDSFGGFTSDKAGVLKDSEVPLLQSKQLKRSKLFQQVSHSSLVDSPLGQTTDQGRQTRSHGPVGDFPNVQPKTIERVHARRFQ